MAQRSRLASSAYANPEFQKLDSFERQYAISKIYQMQKKEQAANSAPQYSFQPTINERSSRIAADLAMRVKTGKIQDSRPEERSQAQDEQESSCPRRVVTEQEYQRNLNDIIQRGNKVLENRQKLEKIAESTSVLLANTVHMSSRSERLQLARKKRFISYLYQQISRAARG